MKRFHSNLTNNYNITGSRYEINEGSPLKITVIGKGQVGKALAASLSRADHEVVFGTRAPSSADEAAIAVAAEAADIVILAVPSAAIGEVVSAAGGLAGKIVIDATNPIA